MDIESFIKREAPSDSDHAQHYAKALREVLKTYQGKPREELLELQKSARIFYKMKGPTHHAVASCMVLQEMINDT